MINISSFGVYVEPNFFDCTVLDVSFIFPRKDEEPIEFNREVYTDGALGDIFEKYKHRIAMPETIDMLRHDIVNKLNQVAINKGFNGYIKYLEHVYYKHN